MIEDYFVIEREIHYEVCFSTPQQCHLYLLHEHQSGSAPSTSIKKGLKYGKTSVTKFLKDEIDEDTHSWLGHHWKVYEKNI